MPYKLRLPNNEQPTTFYSLGELAEACGRSKDTFKKMIHGGQMPEANFRTPPSIIKKGENMGEEIKGHRLYSRDFLVPKLKLVFDGVSQGRKMTDEQKMEMYKAFDDERKMLLNIE
jgi:hypothetical protein